jgi:hypothetical protein
MQIDADLDPAYYFDADTDPVYNSDADPYGSGSRTQIFSK